MDKNKSNFKKKMPEPTIEILTDEQMCRTKGEKEYRDFVKYEARHKAKKSKRERQIQENEDSGKAHYVYRNEHIYQYPYGIEVSFPCGIYPIPEVSPDRHKRGRITSFTKRSKRRFRKALVCLDLPNGATRYAVTLTLPWMNEDWGSEEILSDFNQSMETFRTSFVRCFNHCAMIYRVERQRRGAPHMHAMFYAPRDYDWATDAYSHFEKMRRCKKQEIIDAGGSMPLQPDKYATIDFLHKVFSLLWYNAIKRRPIPKDVLPNYWENGVYVDNVTNRTQTVQISKTIHYMMNGVDDLKRKQWGFIQRRNLIEKKETVDIHDRVRLLVLRDITRCKRKMLTYKDLPPKKKKQYLFTTHHAKRRNPVGIFIGITKKEMDKLIAQAEQNVRERKITYIMPRIIKAQMSHEAELAMARYRNMPDATLTNRYE